MMIIFYTIVYLIQGQRATKYRVMFIKHIWQIINLCPILAVLYQSKLSLVMNNSKHIQLSKSLFSFDNNNDGTQPNGLIKNLCNIFKSNSELNTIFSVVKTKK